MPTLVEHDGAQIPVPSGDSIPVPERFRGIPDSDDPLKRDFRLFLIVIWQHLHLPTPTPLQMSLAWHLQHGGDRSVIMAFRGCAKSWITAAFALWCLYCLVDLKIMVVSGSLKRAVAFTNFCLALIRDVPLLQYLDPGPFQRQSSTAFDVAGAQPDQNPSVNAFGVTGQLAGYRADVIIPDDVETAQNSLTVAMREKILEAVLELEAILKPGGFICYLGTPHAEDSMYLKLGERGYKISIWPARYPTRAQLARYGDRLARYITHALEKDPSLAGKPTEPSRFPEEELIKRELGITSAEFMLQYMLDTSLADANRYPLKLRDLIVLPLDQRRAPDWVTWGNAEELRLPLPVLGFDSDRYYRPAEVAERYSPYDEIGAHIDPSGTGGDECAWKIGGFLSGQIFLKSSASLDGFSPPTLRQIAKDFVAFRVNRCIIESNFGDGMFLALLKPYVIEEWAKHNALTRKQVRTSKTPKVEEGGTALEEVRSVLVQKEVRLLSVLEPIVKQHRLVVAQQVIEDDFKGINQDEDSDIKHRYSLFYQFTHLTREKDSLAHDDRIDDLAGLVNIWAERLGVEPVGYAKARRAESDEDALERLLGGESIELGLGRATTYRPPSNRLKAARVHKR
jgi:hypothetical protein